MDCEKLSNEGPKTNMLGLLFLYKLHIALGFRASSFWKGSEAVHLGAILIERFVPAPPLLAGCLFSRYTAFFSSFHNIVSIGKIVSIPIPAETNLSASRAIMSDCQRGDFILSC